MLINTGNISRKVLSKVLRSFDKNFERLHEACEKCEEKKTIKLKFVIEENLIVLSVKNTCSNLIIYSGNEIKTSKKDEPEMHGIGIKNIIQIVEKYNGEYVIKNENNEFSFSIIIPL